LNLRHLSRKDDEYPTSDKSRGSVLPLDRTTRRHATEPPTCLKAVELRISGDATHSHSTREHAAREYIRAHDYLAQSGACLWVLGEA